MKKFILLFLLFATCLNAQTVNLKITDYKNNLPLNDVDVYFKKSTKNFISNKQGEVSIDLAYVLLTDELIVSKKNYQSAIIKVSNLNSALNIRLEKISKVELKEAFVTNLKAEDILQKVYDNYDENFKVEEYYFLVNFQQDLLYNKTERDFIDTDLQFKFKREDLKIKSKGIVNNEIKSGRQPNTNVRLNYYLESIYLKEKYIKSLLDILREKKYEEADLSLTKYDEHYVYEVFVRNKSREYYLTIDKNSFAVVDFIWETYASDIKLKDTETLTEAKIVYKYRPHSGNWVLKETSAIWNTENEINGINYSLDMNFSVIVNDYNTKSFPTFNRSVNEKKDIRKSFK